MSNLARDQLLKFDTELSINAATFDGTAKYIGTLSNQPVVILFKNQTNRTVFIADNDGSTKGTTMVAGEEFVLDCRANNGIASNMGFPSGTPFYATGAAGIGLFKISILYAG